MDRLQGGRADALDKSQLLENVLELCSSTGHQGPAGRSSHGRYSEGPEDHHRSDVTEVGHQVHRGDGKPVPERRRKQNWALQVHLPAATRNWQEADPAERSGPGSAEEERKHLHVRGT